MSRAAMGRAALVARTALAEAAATAGAAAGVARDAVLHAGEVRAEQIAQALHRTSVTAPAASAAAESAGKRNSRALATLMDTYPMGAALSFRTYDPTIRPRSWRGLAERSPWGLRRGDQLEVVGYGASSGFPEGLNVRRASDGDSAASPEILVFPDELLRES